MYPEPFTTALAPIFKDFLRRGIMLPCIFHSSQRVGAKISDRTLLMNFEDFENKIELFFYPFSLVLCKTKGTHKFCVRFVYGMTQ